MDYFEKAADLFFIVNFFLICFLFLYRRRWIGRVARKTRLRDRKKYQDCEREQERERLNRTSKRRRGDRLLSNREDQADESSEEIVNDDEDGSVRMIPPNNNVTGGSLSIHHQQQHHQQNQHRKSFPVPVKFIRTTTPPSVPQMTTTTTNTSTWKAADEMIGVSVPIKARAVWDYKAYAFCL